MSHDGGPRRHANTRRSQRYDSFVRCSSSRRLPAAGRPTEVRATRHAGDTLEARTGHRDTLTRAGDNRSTRPCVREETRARTATAKHPLKQQHWSPRTTTNNDEDDRRIERDGRGAARRSVEIIFRWTTAKNNFNDKEIPFNCWSVISTSSSTMCNH